MDAGEEDAPPPKEGIYSEGDMVLSKLPQVPEGRSPFSEPKKVMWVLSHYTPSSSRMDKFGILKNPSPIGDGWRKVKCLGRMETTRPFRNPLHQELHQEEGG